MRVFSNTVVPVISFVVRSNPFNATVTFSISEIPEVLEISLYVANGTTAVDEVSITLFSLSFTIHC